MLLKLKFRHARVATWDQLWAVPTLMMSLGFCMSTVSE